MTIKKNKLEDYNLNENPFEIEKKIWKMLNEGVNNRSSEFRTPIFICGFENDFDGRTIVLREANKDKGFLQFHADYRSTKIKTIKTNDLGIFVFYDRSQKIQLRIKTRCKINFKNEICKESWSKTQHISRKCYLTEKSPGAILDKPGTGLIEKYENFKFTKEESEKGFDNFCVFRCYIQTIEWLFLSAKGHRRARFNYENEKNKFVWLTP